MKIVIVLCLCAVAVLGAPTPDEAPASHTKPALKHEETRHDNGEYTLHYVTANGIKVTERGRLVPTLDGTDHVLIYEGEYSFIGDDGKTYTTKYTTDIEGAFQPHGDHLPKAPVIELAKELEAVRVAEPIALVAPAEELPVIPVLMA